MADAQRAAQHGSAARHRAVRRSALLLAVWTLVVWGLRARNIVIDDDITAGAVIPAVCFLAGVAVLVGLLVRNRTELARSWARAGAAVAVLGAGYWLVRTVEIAFDDHSVAFIIVHIILGGGTVVLSLGLLRAIRAWWTNEGIAAGGYGLAGAVE